MTGGKWMMGLVAALAATSMVLVQPASGQIGAIGAAPGGAVSADETAAQSPVFGQSALTMPRGTVSGSAVIGVTGGSFPFGLNTIDFTVTQMLLGAFYAPTDRSVIGVTMFPYYGVTVEGGGVSNETNGRGDGALFGKYQFWMSGSGRTSLAGLAQVSLPLGDDDFGANGTVVGIGGALTHALQRMSLHGAVSVSVPTDDADGNSALSFTTGLVYAASPSISISGELIGSSTTDALDERYTSIELAPGIRWRASRSIYLNGGVQFNVSTSVGAAPYDYAGMIGISISR